MNRVRRSGWVIVCLILAVNSVANVQSDQSRERSYFTDLPLTDQHGKQLRFYTDVLQDRVVLMNFIFTKCPGACPIMTRTMVQVKDKIGSLFGDPVHFVSISIDPDRDTPEAMLAYAEALEAVHPAWSFLTADKKTIETVVGRLGQYNEEVEMHSTMMLAANTKTKHWIKLRPNMPAEAIAMKLEDLAAED